MAPCKASSQPLLIGADQLRFPSADVPCHGPFTELLGAPVVTVGSVHGWTLVAQRGWRHFRRSPHLIESRDVRTAIGENMALALDFFLAGDIVGTIVVPSQESFLTLGEIVMIRTATSLFPAKVIDKR